MKNTLLAFSSLLLVSSVQAAPPGQFCIRNHVTDSYLAMFTNVSVGVKIFRNLRPVVESTEGEPVHIHWGDEYCTNISAGDKIRVYRKTFFSDWEYRRSYDLKWLSGLDLYLGKAGRLDTEMGYSLKYDASDTVDYHPALWMSQLFAAGDRTVKLRELCIPGTHASGSYYNNKPMVSDPYMSSSFKKLSDRFTNSKINLGGFAEKKQGKEYYLSWWIKTQSESISRQLALGARYLSMKVIAHDGKFYTARGLVGAPVDTVLDQVKAFLEKSTDEIIILHFDDTRSLNTSEHQLLFERIEEKLGNLLVSEQLGSDVTASDLYETPGRVIILYQQGHYSAPQWLWEDGHFTRRFSAITGNPDLFLRKMQHQYAVIKPSRQFEITDMYLTPSSADFDAFGSSLTLNWGKDFSGTLKYLSGITQYLSGAASNAGRRLNIISHDYIEEGDLFGSCMTLNHRLLNGETEYTGSGEESVKMPYDEIADKAEKAFESENKHSADDNLASTKVPESTEVPDKPEASEKPEVPDSTDVSEKPEVPESTEASEKPEVPESTEAPEKPEVSGSAESVDNSENKVAKPSSSDVGTDSEASDVYSGAEKENNEPVFIEEPGVSEEESDGSREDNKEFENDKEVVEKDKDAYEVP